MGYLAASPKGKGEDQCPQPLLAPCSGGKHHDDHNDTLPLMIPDRLQVFFFNSSACCKDRELWPSSRYAGLNRNV